MKTCKPILILTIFLLMLAGCANQNPSQDEAIDITMLGGSPTGVWFMITNGISECIQSSYPGSVVLITPGAGTTNPIRVGNREADVAMMSNLMVIAAQKGMEPYGSKIENLAAIAGFYPSTFQMVVTEDLGISSFDEIIDKKLKVRLSIEQSGSSANIIFERILAEYGTTIEDMEQWGAKIMRKNFAESSNMLSDGSLDGFSLSTIVPSPPIVESSIGKNLVLLDMNPQIMLNMAQKYGYSLETIPGGVYDFRAKDYSTISTKTILGAFTELDEDTAYAIARSIVENIDYMRNVHSALKDITPESLSSEFSVKLHPGALKYYREIGVVK